MQPARPAGRLSGMTDVVETGRPDGRRAGRRTAFAAALALVLVAGAGAVAYARHARPRPSAAAPTTPAGTATPPASPVPEETGAPPLDPFASYAVLPGPAAGGVRAVTLPGGEPAFLVQGLDQVVAVSAVASVPPARAVLAYCRDTGMFEDPTGAYRFDQRGWSYDETAYATTYDVRPHPGHPGRVEVAGTGIELGGTDIATGAPPPRCRPSRLLRAPLPPYASSLLRLGNGWRRVHGSLFVTYATSALCPTRRRSGCLEPYRPVEGAGLQPGALAGRVEYDGNFLVHEAGGSLTAARLPGDTERRTNVGAAVRVGFARRVTTSGGRTTLRLDACRWYTGAPADDSPGGQPRGTGPYAALVTDPRDGARDYPVRPGAEIWVAANAGDAPPERTTPAGLGHYLVHTSDKQGLVLVWVVLDARGRAIRVIEEPEPR
jgi:hypothetical protein